MHVSMRPLVLRPGDFPRAPRAVRGQITSNVSVTALIDRVSRGTA